jgi:threonine/homoserine/homoserine lactone efflux protein
MVSPVYIRLASSSTRAPAGLLARVVAGLFTLLAVVALLMFSVVAVGVLLVGGAVFLGYLWWKTRALRRALKAQPSMQQTPFAQRSPAANDDGMVIEGESIREVPEHEGEAPRR